MRNKTGTHVFWENGVDYPRVSPGAHPLAKKPEDSGHEIDRIEAHFVLLINNVRNRFLVVFIHHFSGERKVSRVLATSSERFHHIKIQIQKLSTV